MLKNKLSHIAILNEQLDRLQKSANEISVITGRDLESVENAIASLLTQRGTDQTIYVLQLGRDMIAAGWEPDGKKDEEDL